MSRTVAEKLVGKKAQRPQLATEIKIKCEGNVHECANMTQCLISMSLHLYVLGHHIYQQNPNLSCDYLTIRANKREESLVL